MAADGTAAVNAPGSQSVCEEGTMRSRRQPEQARPAAGGMYQSRQSTWEDPSGGHCRSPGSVQVAGTRVLAWDGDKQRTHVYFGNRTARSW